MHLLESQPSSRTGENSPYGMIGGIEETSASFEARSAPRSYPTIPDLVGTAEQTGQLSCRLLGVVCLFDCWVVSQFEISLGDDSTTALKNAVVVSAYLCQSRSRVSICRTGARLVTGRVHGLRP